MITTTNTLQLRQNLINSIKETTESTERLSSGKRLNSAADDPSIVGTISRLSSEIASVSQALRNGSNAKSLTQITENGLSEIDNLLSRVRELAVQGANSTLTTADRTSMQTEVDSYLTEIDNITKVTKFNDLKVLDGSIKKVTFIIGIDKDGLFPITLTDADSSALGLSGQSGVKEFTSGRVSGVNYSSANLGASEIKINGQNALAATLSSNLSAGNNTANSLATAINANSNTHGAEATAFNSLTSAPKSTLSMSNTFTINSNTISIQTSLENLTAEINQEVSGVTATHNTSDNTITLFNNTGNDIVIAGNAPTDAGFTAGTYLGYLKLKNVDGTFVKIEPMTKNNGYASNTGNVSDLANFGFNEIDSSTIISSGLVSANSLTNSHDIKINDIAVGESTSSSASAKAVSINAISSSTNVTASASNLVTLVLDLTNLPSSSQVSINGSTVDFSSVGNTAAVVTAINNASIGDIIASANSEGNLEIKSPSGVDITIAHSGTPTHLFASHTDATDASISRSSSVTFKGRIALTHSEGDIIKISGTNVSEIGFEDQASSSASSPGSIISLSSASNSSSALTTIDTAIDTVSKIRSEIGAFENKIDHQIDLLSNVEVSKKTRLSKLQDADFALETARLTKSQIISSVATSMLAQANISGRVFLRLLN